MNKSELVEQVAGRAGLTGWLQEARNGGVGRFCKRVAIVIALTLAAASAAMAGDARCSTVGDDAD